MGLCAPSYGTVVTWLVAGLLKYGKLIVLIGLNIVD